MVIRGRIENGVVVLPDGVSLPEGAEVTVEVCAPPPGQASLMTPEQRQRMMDAFSRIEALPDENPGDTFSGADHDKVLYGGP